MADRFSAEASARISEASGESARLAARRAEAFERYAVSAWPDQSAEEWRHADIRGLDLEAFTPGDGTTTIRDAPSEAEHDLIGTAPIPEFERTIVEFNAAFGSVRFIVIPRGTVLDDPIRVEHSVGRDGAFAPRTVIVAGENSSATVVEHVVGEDGSLVVSAVELYAEQAANVSLVSVQDLPQSSWYLNASRFVVGKDASVRSVVATLGARFSRSVTQSYLDGAGAHAEMLGVYFGDTNQFIDNRTLQFHRAPNTSSILRYKGALKGNARAIYMGRVDIEKDAPRSDAQQENRNLLLSRDASALPEPFLEIKTSEVVRATHGVSVGRPDPQVLFYLQSRGLDPAAAERLFVTGFFQEVLDRVPDAETRELLERAVERELALEA